MTKKLVTCLTVSVLLLFSNETNAFDSSAIEQMKIGETMPDFELKDFLGKSWSSGEFESSKTLAVVFMGVECPLVKLYSSRLNKLEEQYGDEIQIIGIYSNQQDSVTEMEIFAKLNRVEFPMLKDPANRVADAFGAQRTPDVYLFNAQRKLCYRGAIDDQYTYGKQKHKPENMFLADAVKAVIAGKRPTVEQTESEGCVIGRIMKPQPNSPVTYAKQISRLLNDRCVNCHRPGEVAPFSLTDYDEVVGWAEMIQEVVNDRRMPPWHANPEHGKFANDVSLTNEQHALIETWVNNGAPFGDSKDLPEPPKFVEGWQIGEPDDVFLMSDTPFQVPATGVVDYQYFVVDPGFTEDKWIQAAECRPGNRAVVHHIIVGVKKDGRKTTHAGEIEDEWLTATAPGSPPLELADGLAKFVPAGAKLFFQMHYTPNGTPQTDLSSVGFKFADPKTVRKTVGTIQVVNNDFEIPPHADSHEVSKTYRFQRDSLLLAMFPHMHLRGKSFRYTVEYPPESPRAKRKSEILLDVPEYDFNWQNGYQFAEPKRIPAGTILTCVAHFDNSEKNFANPDPEKTVTWGDQTSDEMMIGYFDMALADQDLTKSESNPRTLALLERIKAGEEVVTDEIKELTRASLSSRANMNRFGRQLHQAFPNIDRVCWTTITDKTLSVDRVVQVPGFRERCKGEGETIDASGTKLSQIQKSGKPTAIGDVRHVLTQDMIFMSAAAKSSFHIPIEVKGKPGTINFWSGEINAFPESVQTLLIQIVNESLPSGE